MAKKKVLALVKIQIPAGQATPAPPVGTALGPHGVAIMDFCKAYNAATENQRGTIVPVDITVFEDRSFTFVLKTPAHPGADPPGGRPREGLRHHRSGDRRQHHRRPGGRDRPDQDARPQRQRPRRPPSSRSPAPPGAWASRSSSEQRLDREDLARTDAAQPPGEAAPTEGVGSREAGRSRRGTADKTGATHGEGQEVQRRGEEVRPRPAVQPERGDRAGEGPRHRQVRRVDRARRPPRGGPPQGRPDRARHRRPALGHGQGRARGGVRQR